MIIVLTSPPFSSSPSIASAGAVPRSFGKIMAPSGIIACFALFSVIVQPREAKYSAILFCDIWSKCIFRPSSSAAVSLVMSSQVGPSPPVVMSRSARPSDSAIAALSLSGLSPTTPCRKTGIPSPASLPAR